MQHGLLKLGLVGAAGEFPVPLTAAAFAIALLGSGSWSIDGLLGLTYSDAFRWIWVAVVAVGVVAALLTKGTLAPKKTAP